MTALSIEKMLTPDDVSTLLGVPRRRLAFWRETGRELPFHKFGKFVRYHPKDVQKYLNDTRQIPVQASMETAHGR